MTEARPQKSGVAFYALLLLTIYYFLRPEDVLTPLAYIPLGKIMGGASLLALFMVPAKDRAKLPPELKVLLLLLATMMLDIPFAFWIAGSIQKVVIDFSKAVIVALLVFFAVNSLQELRRLLYWQSALVALVAVASVAVHRQDNVGRLMGVQRGFLENPNDLAINIAINFPLCMAFLLEAKGLRKLPWLVGLGFMSYAVVETYSRSGALALSLTAVICIWEFGIKGKRTYLLAGVVFVAMAGVIVMLAQPHYLARLETLVKGGDVAGGFDRGSIEARSELLKEALSLGLHHPVFGVGPGNFESASGQWHVAHNTYAELWAETGLPGLTIFVLLLLVSLRRVRKVAELPSYAAVPEIRLWTSALWAGMAAYTTGAMFASTEYNLFPYFIVGYICALYNIASRIVTEPEPAGKKTEGARIRRRSWRRRWEPVGVQG